MSTQGYQSQTTLQEPALLRGYAPLKEYVQWNTLAGFFAGTLAWMSVISSPPFLNGTLPAGEVWTGISVFLLVVLFLFVCAVPVLPLWVHARREERQRKRWRRDAFQGTDLRLVSPQPVAPERPLPLPLHLESRPRRALFPLMGVGGVIVVMVLLSGYLWMSGDTGDYSQILVEVFSFLSFLSLLSCLGSAHLLQRSIAAHYLHPQLHIDTDSITARYGHDTITMAWCDIRSFALFNSKMPDARFQRKAPWREVFELSDGENRICWLAHQPLSSYRLFSRDGTDLRESDYTTFTQQLAALIVARTHLPLLDFRLEEKKQEAQANTSQHR